MTDAPRATLTDTAIGDERLRPPRGLRGASGVRHGDKIGRYVVLDRLGAGGMGVVYVAYDAELGRKIAIKLMHGTATERSEARLVREARAMARLSDPHVITVNDVGTHDGRVFVAMEFVDGATLRDWLETPRHWTEVVDVMLGAGRGLQAAHDAGILHRDFKPDNVMIDKTGRVRVLDFGLAASADQTDASPGATSSGGIELTPSPGPADSKLSRTGRVMGTPAYLAPELHLGLPATLASDEFAFCVALYEGLYGRRPFAGGTLAQLALNVTRGALEEPPRTTDVPGAIWRIVRRGLDVDADARWPTMADLLEALEGQRRPSRRWAWMVGAAAVTAIAVAWSSADEASTTTCTDGADRIRTQWSDARADEIAGAFAAASDDPWLAAVWPRAATRLDAWTERWGDAWRTACEARHVRREWTGETLDRAVACLEDRQQDLAATLELLESTDGSARRRVIELVEELPAPETCMDPERASTQDAPPSDPAVARRISDLQARFAVGNALGTAGRIDDSLSVLVEVEGAALDTGYGPLIARVHRTLGIMHGRAGDAAKETRLLREAYFEATEAGVPDLAVEAAADLVRAYLALDETDEAESWLRHSRAQLATLPEATDLRAEVETAAGRLYVALGKYDEAASAYAESIALLEQGNDRGFLSETLAGAGFCELERGHKAEGLALMNRGHEIRTEMFGPEHPAIANSLISTGMGLKRTGDLDAAAERTAQALALYRRIFGPKHPNVAGAMHNLGSIELERGNLEAAASHLQPAVAIRREVYGDDHALVAASMAVLGSVAEDQGDIDRARALYGDALAIFEARLGPEHPYVGDMLHNVGTAAEAARDFEASLEAHRRALAIREAALGPDHPDVATSLSSIGGALRQLGRNEEALEQLQRARQIGVNAYGEDDPFTVAIDGDIGGVLVGLRPAEAVDRLREAIARLDAPEGSDKLHLASLLKNLGRAYVRLGDDEAAVPVLRRALQLRSDERVDPVWRSGTRALLAQALRTSDPVEARRLARLAREDLEAQPQRYAEPLAEIDALRSDLGG